MAENFNNWTIIGKDKKDKNGRTLYRALCSCGLIAVRRKDYFTSGESRQCRECFDKTRFSCSPGYKFGKWTIISEHKNKYSERSYLCKCSCGKEKTVRLRDLLRKKSTQCVSCHISEKNATHKSSKTKTYRIWAGIKDRCKNKNNKSFRWYGERGISFDKRWERYEAFYEDMGMCPPGATIDRIDPDGDYNKINCRWVSFKENHENRRCSKKNRHLYAYIKTSKLCKKCRTSGHVP